MQSSTGETSMQTLYQVSDYTKGLVINYEEGGLQNGENRGSETFCAPSLETG